MAAPEDEGLDPYAAAASTTAGGLFYSTRTDWATAATHRQHQPAAGGGGRGAISLVESAHESHPDAASRDALSLSLDDDDDDDDHHLLDNAPRTGKGAQVQGAGSSSIVAALPAFVSRVAGAGGGGRGWKAYESIAASSRAGAGGALSRHVVYSDDEDDDDDDEEDDEPVPGAFVSPQPTTSTSANPKGTSANIAPAPTTTLHVYPVPGPNGYNEPHGEDRYYRDSIWIVLYGMSLLAVVALALQAFWTSPPPSPPPSSSRDPSNSLFLSALPTLSLLGAISAIAGIASLAYLLTIPYALPLLLRFAIYGGPALLFVVTGIVAFAGSYGLGGGVASDRGWKVGVRWLAAGCFVMGFGLFRSAVARRKELNRAISVGQLACQTVLAHPSLIVLAISLSLLSAILTLPFLSLIATLLSYSPSSPKIASWGTAWTVLVYWWTLAIARGLSHAVVGGCIGTWYFEREDDEYQGPAEVTRASIARATGPSLGTVIAASFFVAIFSTLATLLHSLRRLLESSRLPSLCRPFLVTWLAPLLASLASYAAFFNAYSLSYAGMTGEGFWTASRETAELFRANRARNIRDTALLRLTLFVSSAGWGLLTGLVAFFLTSTHLSPLAGGYAPTLALLCYAIPMYTLRLCHNLIGDAVDALFVCAHLDAENQLSHCPKAVEAFGTPEAEGDVLLSLPI
ncbi:hypothetical protein B0A53_06371 [Rhodotorula sp. CCFEE 5036]|nr:hypothetical protein B0A53_06371 [Rhodotorula sp. CCFEE 5036]